MLKIRLPHIHRWNIIDLLFEQPTGAKDIYMDLKIKKCRCGKEKKVLINMYKAERARITLECNPDISYVGLVNKISLI